MTTCGDILKFLDKKFPLKTALDFDNAGLLIGDKSSAVSKAVICLDCNKQAAERAISEGANLIITHHPVIFEGEKKILSDGIIFALIKNGISVISMHTNMDAGKGGVNDCLAKSLGLTSVKPFDDGEGFLLRQAKVSPCTADSLAEKIKTSLNTCVKYVGCEKEIENILLCSGSGGDYLSLAAEHGFDALITADCKHHKFIEAENTGIALFDCGHYESENVIIRPLFNMLKKEFEDTEFSVQDNTALKFI